MKALLEGLKALGPARLAALAAVGLSLFALLAIMATHTGVGVGGGGGRMSLLYADLDLREAAQIADQLTAQHIPHEVSAGGDTITVPADEVGPARLLLARQGLPTGGSIGYELFDHADALTASSFEQRINETRALEGELARTIEAISGVRAARINLVLPRREPFAREQQEAQASVMLTMVGERRMDREGVQAVLNLVSAAVPGLRPQNVAIVDSRGDVLSRAGDPSTADGAAQGLEEVKVGIEQRLSRAVEAMLERSLGAGRVRAEAAVDLDFAQVHETEEKFDPNGQVARSEQNVTDSSQTTEAGATVSVANNLPNANAGAKPGAGSQSKRSEATTNYEIGKTVRTIVRDQPEIRRISLAVMVDGKDAPGADGKLVWTPRTPEELAQITALVRSAIGYDEKRGDSVEVATMRFVAEDQGPATPQRMLFGIPINDADLMRLAQSGLFGVLGLLGLLLVLRPMVLRLTALPPSAALLAADGLPADALAGPEGTTLALVPDPAGGPPRLAGPAGAVGPYASAEYDAMIDLANVEGQLRASLVRRLSDMVERHPNESLALVRSWMQQGAA
jgi:flagellar M-ring protein FliF